jgi:hypothetical protein
LIIADDDALARALIEAIVERDRDLELVGSAEDAERAIELHEDPRAHHSGDERDRRGDGPGRAREGRAAG